MLRAIYMTDKRIVGSTLLEKFGYPLHAEKREALGFLSQFLKIVEIVVQRR
jgi:hypothetical protein